MSTELKDTSSSRFWWGFWVTILVLAIVYIGANLKRNALLIDANGEVSLTQEGALKFQQVLPEFLGKQATLLDVSQQQIHAIIDRHVSIALAPVYAQVSTYADFHYSVIGEYTELSAALLSELPSTLQKTLFLDTRLAERLNTSLSHVETQSRHAISLALAQMDANLRLSLGLNKQDRQLLGKVITLTMNDVDARFSDTLNAIRVTSTAAGTGTAVVAAKWGSKMLLKSSGKVLGKTALKSLEVGTGAATGAAIGSTLLPGVGTLIGGVIGATVVWFATDKIIVEVDEHLHREAFEASLMNVLKEEEQRIKSVWQQAYTQLLKDINDTNTRRLNHLRPIDLINP